MSYRSAAVLILCVLAIGCRTDPHRALREREMMLLENRIYELEECVHEYERALAISELDNRQLRCDRFGSPPATGPSAAGASATGTAADPRLLNEPPRSSSPPRNPTTPEPPSRINSGRRLPRVGPLRPPTVEIHDPPIDARSQEGSDTSGPRLKPEPRDGQSQGALPPLGNRIGTNAEASLPNLATQSDSRVSRVALAKLATGGYDAEPEPGDEGVTLILRPLDADGNLIFAAAPVAIVVMDPELLGDASRIARWDFSLDEVAKSFRKSGLSEGIHLNMRWPDAPPAHSDLMLFVRYTTRDGRHLETHQTIRIDPPDSHTTAGRPGAQSGDPEETTIDPTAKPVLDPPPRTVPHELPAADVARRKTSEPRIATKPDRSRPTWSPNR